MGKGSPDNHQNKNRDREPALLVDSKLHIYSSAVEWPLPVYFLASQLMLCRPYPCQTPSGAAFPP